MHSTKSVIIFVFILTAIVAVTLAGLSTFLKPIHIQNEAVYNKKAILSAVADHLDTDFSTLNDEQVDEIFQNKMVQSVLDMQGNVISEDKMMELGYKNGTAEAIDMSKEMKKPEKDRLLPVYVFENVGKKFYILNVRGKGLWDEIWGCVALENDLNTIAGVAFDHKAETPGLGAEIKDNIAWKNQFTGKKIFNSDGSFRSVLVRKGGAKDDVYEVDGISGATITADGVTEMMRRGLAYYQPYIDSVKK